MRNSKFSSPLTVKGKHPLGIFQKVSSLSIKEFDIVYVAFLQQRMFDQVIFIFRMNNKNMKMCDCGLYTDLSKQIDFIIKIPLKRKLI